MRCCIPSIGDKMKLTKSWTFPLYLEYRNIDLINRFRPGTNSVYTNGSRSQSIMVTFEKGTVLRVDRIYIRKGKSEWDSITFVVAEAPKDDKRPKTIKSDVVVNGIPDHDESKVVKLKGGRFWAKLNDVNEINFEMVE